MESSSRPRRNVAEQQQQQLLSPPSSSPSSFSSPSFSSSSASSSNLLAAADGLGRLIDGLLGRPRALSEPAELWADLADGVVIEHLASLWRPLAPYFKSFALVDDEQRRRDLSAGRAAMLRREASPLRRRDQLTRLCEALKAAALLPAASPLCAKPSDVARSVAAAVAGGPEGQRVLFELAFEFLALLQVQRVSDYSRAYGVSSGSGGGGGGGGNDGGMDGSGNAEDMGGRSAMSRSPARRLFVVRHTPPPRSLHELQRWVVGWTAERVRGRGKK